MKPKKLYSLAEPAGLPVLEKSVLRMSMVAMFGSESRNVSRLGLDHSVAACGQALQCERSEACD